MMVEGAERVAYDRHAELAWLVASGLCPKESGDWQVSDFHPYMENTGKLPGMQLTGDVLAGMKGLAGRVSKISAKDVKVVEK